ncbi:hypothetical protein, partial [Escherichia coli]|uniref:hypothetical protein n=1 Tax=Escherichia coli TaxID=562 RepID=UPI002B2540E6
NIISTTLCSLSPAQQITVIVRFFILLRDKKRPLLKLQGPGTSKHHIGRHDATVKIIWPDGVQ